MKVILSRKGFDSQYGGKPSIIYPDKEMLSFPIPVEKPQIGISPNELFSRGTNLNQIFKELHIKPFTSLHLDPDIRYNITKIRDKTFIGSFGQSSAALAHLNNKQVSKGDLFLFYGTFNFVKINNGHIHYDKSIPFHAIWGYLYVDQIITDISEIENNKELAFLKAHPHFINRNLKHYKTQGNSIFIGKKYGVFNFSETLRLTKLGYQKSYWCLPSFFKNITISYHEKVDYEIDTVNNKCNIQTVGRGQEFIFEANNDVLLWINDIIGNVRKSD